MPSILDYLAGMTGGGGLAQQAQQTNSLYPIWQQQYLRAAEQGISFPKFEDWLRSQGYTPINR